MEFVKVKKSWGTEVWFENNDLYCGKEITMDGGYWSSDGKFHYHKLKDETFYVLDGYLEVHLFGNGVLKHLTLKKGEALRIRPGTPHRFRARYPNWPTKFVEVSTHHEDSDSYYDIQPPHLGSKEKSYA